MSFAFKPHEPLPHAVRRIAGRQVDRTIEALARGGRRPPSKAIHDARKRLKRLRALLRLAREGMSGKARRRENETFRDAGRALSAARDAGVLVTALDALLEHAGVSARRRRRFLALRRALLSRRREASEHPDAAEIRDIVKALRQASKRTDDWKLKHLTHRTLLAGLRRTYTDGRRAMGRAIRSPQPELLHEWRKRAKDLSYHAQLLAAVWSPDMQGFDQRVHHLADLLGDDHDLAVLRQALTNDPHALGVSEVLHGWIDARGAELQREAISLGHDLYDKPPGDFIKEAGACAWGDESR